MSHVTSLIGHVTSPMDQHNQISPHWCIDQFLTSKHKFSHRTSLKISEIFFFFYRHHLVIPSPSLTEEVATSAGVDAPVPRALLIGRLPLAPVGDRRDAGERLGRHRVGTEVTDLQLLEVLHEVLERHPATQTGRRVDASSAGLVHR